MTEDYQRTIVLRFNECINNRDIQGLAALMTNDHTFIDSANSSLQGMERVVAAWKSFFALFPDYRNVFERVEARTNLVVIVGRSTCSEPQLDGPALWTAQVRDDKIAEWRVYKDTSENRQALDLS